MSQARPTFLAGGVYDAPSFVDLQTLSPGFLSSVRQSNGAMLGVTPNIWREELEPYSLEMRTEGLVIKRLCSMHKSETTIPSKCTDLQLTGFLDSGAD